MRLIKKFALISGIFLSSIVIVLSGAGIYLYCHPERIKTMIEGALASATGSSCGIERLSLSLKPLAIEAGGIFLKNPDSQQAFSMEIPFIRTDMTVEGPWSHRTLILENTQVRGVSMNFTSQSLPPLKKSTSFPARMAKGLVSLLFFRDVRFQSGEILDGQVSASLGDQTVQAFKIYAKANVRQPLFFSFALEAENASRKMSFKAPNVTLAGGNAFDINDPEVSGTLQAKNIKFRDAGLEIRNMDIESTFTYYHATQNLDAENLEVCCEGIALAADAGAPFPPIDIRLTAEGISSRYPVFDVTNAILQILPAKIRPASPHILNGNIRFHFPKGRIDTGKKSVSMPEVQLEAFGLKNLFLDILVEENRINLTLQGKKTAILQAAAAYRLLPPDWNISAKDAIRINASGLLTGPWQVDTKLSFEDLAFKNRDESLMGERISLSARMESVVSLENSSMTFNTAFEAKSGETLYDRYYLDLGKNAIVSSFNGICRFRERLLELSRFRFDLTDILPVEIKGHFKQGAPTGNPGKDKEPASDFTVIITRVPLAPIFQFLLQESYKNEKSFLANLETAGTVSSEVRIQGSENGWQAKGRIGWQEGALGLPDKGIALKGIHLDLPVWYQAGWSGAADEGLRGKLAIQSMAVYPLPEQPLNILITTAPNRISVDSPTMIRIPGGNLLLGPVQAENVFSRNISVLTRLALDEINLQPFLSGIRAIPPDGAIKGALTGKLDPVRYESHSITSQGELTADVFGGTLILSDLGASGIFTSAPVFKLNAHWKDLLLAEMTTDTTFGKIEGILKGHIRDFEIASGQPQKFDLLVETVPKKGIPQTISIKAIDNIAQIGGGQSPFMGLAGSFASVFKKFPYKKIGIRAYLENDMFTINGTSKEGRTEYLVKRGSVSGVNIVNQNPDNRISFKDMVKRIKRITRKGGAVVH